MTAVLLSGDLMVLSRVAGAAAAAGIDLRTASSVEQAAELCREATAEMLIVDLGLGSVDPSVVVAAVKSPASDRPIVLAFGPHVHEHRLAAAREAGCDRIVSRGQFFSRLEELLQI